MPIVTRKSKVAFPEIAQIRKGAAKEKTNGKEIVGKDLGESFRLVWYPGNEQAQKEFEAIFGASPKQLIVTLAFNELDMVWDNWLEAYTAGRMIARTDGEKFLYWIDNKTGERKVVNGEPFTPWHEGMQVGSYVNRTSGKTVPVYCKEVGRLKLVVPALARMAYFTLHTTSYHDCEFITEQLGALKELSLRYRFHLAGIPLLLRRRIYDVTHVKEDGSAQRVKKWLINLEADPEWMKRMFEQMKFMSLPAVPGEKMRLASGEVLEATAADYQPQPGEIEDDPEEDGDQGIEQGGEEGIQEGQVTETTATPLAGATPQPSANIGGAAAETKRPYKPETIREKLQSLADGKYAGYVASEEQRKLLRYSLELCFAGQKEGEAMRHAVAYYLTGSESTSDIPGPFVKAMLDAWLQPKKDSGGDYSVISAAVQEAQVIYTASLVAEGQEQLSF